ncbi:hypothetical protein D3C87_2181710 [compost metagenome]
MTMPVAAPRRSCGIRSAMMDMLIAPSTPPVMPAKARDSTSTWKFGASAQARLDRLNSMNTVSCSFLRSKRSA